VLSSLLSLPVSHSTSTGGIDEYNQWADGISVACPKSVVRNNMINTPTDGGIVIFGPEVLVENNTIWVETHSLSGGIVRFFQILLCWAHIDTLSELGRHISLEQ
jgi:hypothetical protein